MPTASAVVDSERAARLRLSHVAEPGDANLGRRIEAVGAVAALSEIQSGKSQLVNAGWLQERLRALEASPARIDECGRYLIPTDPQWPQRLADLGSRAPIGLFVTGSGELPDFLENSISVVGTRSASNYGRQVANAICGELAYLGVCVVSGAAFGVDAAAHQAALAVGGNTLAVLPGGALDDYPPSHAELLANIRERGIAISEVPNGSHPTRPRFLQRNRLIAALTPASLIIEAPWRSGALSTARWASTLLRLVLGVPGAVTAPMSAGVNRLIREREAELVTSADDVIEALATIGEGLAPKRDSAQTKLDLLTGLDATIFEALPAKGGVSLEGLAKKVDSKPAEIASALGRLQLQGLVVYKAKGWAIVRHALYGGT